MLVNAHMIQCTHKVDFYYIRRHTYDIYDAKERNHMGSNTWIIVLYD